MEGGVQVQKGSIHAGVSFRLRGNEGRGSLNITVLKSVTIVESNLGEPRLSFN